MKKAIILLTGIIVFSLSGLVGQSTAHEKLALNHLFFVEENDPVLEVEAWMLDEKIWNDNKSISIVEEEDSELELEPWMVQSSVWN